MADADFFNADMFTGQWSRPDAENPRLASPITDVATGLVSTNALLDEDGAAVTGNVLMGVKNKDGYTESVWFGAASSTDGITWTGGVRGIDLSGLDNTTNNTSSLAVAHESGEPIFVQQSGVVYKQMIGAMAGTIAGAGIFLLLKFTPLTFVT